MRAPLVGRVTRRRTPTRKYPRVLRVNEVLREVLAEAIEREASGDPRLDLATVTAVHCDPDLRHATVFLSSLPGPAAEALAEARLRLQSAVANEVRIKRTPQLSFEADPAIEYGERVELVLRGLRWKGELPWAGEPEVATGSVVEDATGPAGAAFAASELGRGAPTGGQPVTGLPEDDG